MPQELFVIPFFLVFSELLQKATDGHIGDCDQPGERHIEASAQFAAIGFLQLGLVGGQDRAARVVDEV